ncbi:Somatostatin receptor type 5 [Aphelenchoides bicaudatus]|nr:Somatostatin receptor type 5 [Aphelenchoides bicaudatus]
MSNLTRVIMQQQSPAAAQTESTGLQHMRTILTIMHLFLVSIGSINLLVVFVIASRRYMRSITNVYILSLCIADFLYLANLILVAATQINEKSWPFGQVLCTVYHGTESTGKYASVIFVVLLAADRFCAMCKPNLCSRYRNYKVALCLSIMAWTLAMLAATPLFAYSVDAVVGFRPKKLCFVKWPSSEAARWYITISSVLIFALPLTLIIFFYYHILNKLREAVKGNKRMRRASSSRAPYHRVTRLVLWVVIFHVISWTPFWLFNLLSSVFQMRVSTPFDRVVVNVIHLFPYLNCALNPLVYAINAENFRRAFRSIFCLSKRRGSAQDSHFTSNGLSTRSVLVSGMNASSERLLSINNYAPLSIGQKCSNTVLLNGSIFLPHTSNGPSGTNTKRNSSNNSLVVGADEQEYRRASGTVVRFATIDSNDEGEDCSSDSAASTLPEVEKITNNNVEPKATQRISDTTMRIGNYMQNPLGLIEDQMEGDVFM